MIIDTSGVGGVGGDWDWPKLARESDSTTSRLTPAVNKEYL